MKTGARILFCILLLPFCMAVAQSQSRTRTASNLKAVVNAYAARIIRTLNRTGSMGRHKVENQNTFHSDVDGDGDFDAVVEIFFCEYESCHPTTNSSKLVVFLNNRGVYRFAADRGFVLYGKINSIEDAKISVDIYSLDENDPQCCPQLKRNETYSFRGTKLVKVETQ